MASGVEIAGIVLAMLPLLVKKVDDYAEGLATLKSFRTRAYRRDMDLYAATLGTQSAILTNSITMLIEDVLDQDLDAPSQSAARHGVWLSTIQKSKIDQRLRQCLAHDYELFVTNVKVLSRMLEELSDKLNLSLQGQSKVSHQDQPRLLAEVKKFKDVFSKSIYEAILSRIESTNSTLRTLADDALRRDHYRRTRRGQARSLSHHQAVRYYAKTLRRAVLNQKHWRCGSQHKHRVEFVLRKAVLGKTGHSSDQGIAFSLAMLLSDHGNPGSSGQCTWKGHIIEATPVSIPQPKSANPNVLPIRSSTSYNRCGNKVIANKTSTMQSQTSTRRKVQFAVATTTIACVTQPPPLVQPSPAQGFLKDICDAIHNKTNENLPPDAIETFSLIENALSEHYHSLKIVREIDSPERTTTITDALSAASTASLWTVKPDSLYVWRNRLRLATLIATHFIGIHDSWLPQTWKLSEIALTQLDAMPPDDYTGPDCCIWIEIPSCFARPSDPELVSRSPLIQNRTIFRLGVALVELAACQSLASLRLPEDVDVNEDVTDLKTASRLLDNIALQYGDRYGAVVRRCLFWNGPRSECLDDEDFQRAVYDDIVLPLLDDYETAQGAYHK